MHETTVLIVLDGWGYNESKENNAINSANTPFFDSLWEKYPHCFLDASGGAVGLPENQMGNSEVGHMTIGSGKIIDTDLVKISKSFKDKNFQRIEIVQELFKHVKDNNSTLHILGLLSSGGVHSYNSHLYDYLKLAKENNINKIKIHIFTDGRDTAPQSGFDYVKELENFLSLEKIGNIASLSGRYYAMDRDNNWDRIEKTIKVIFKEDGCPYTDTSPLEIIKDSYANEIFDEYIEPIHFGNESGFIEKNDGILFFNFRSDRAKELSKKIEEKIEGQNIYFSTMTEYDKNLHAHVIFPPDRIETTLANEIAKNNLSQVHIAETEKFAHATYFLNCGEDIPHKGEEFILIESRKDIKTHDLAPEMKAKEITDKAIEYLEKNVNFIFINYANADILGHTANVDAIKKGLEFLDMQLERLVKNIEAKNKIAFITADHGNAETNIDPNTGEKHTAHTTNLVPAIIVSNKNIKLKNGTLANIAPTILNLMNLSIPASMSQDLIIK